MKVTEERLYQFTIQERGIGYVRLTDMSAFEQARAIRAAVQTYIRQVGALRGLLVDVQGISDLSIVQLSALVDTLSEVGLPLAVVVQDETQHRLANLLLRTLPNQQQIVYMITLEGAYSYLNARHTSPLEESW